MKPVVAVDLDEVLGVFVEQLALYHNKAYGTVLTGESFHSYDFHLVWGGTQEEASKKMQDFFKSDEFLDIPEIPQAKEVLERHKEAIEFHIVTSRQLIIEDITRTWVAKHYPGLFSGIHLGNHYVEGAPQRSKLEMCRAIGARMLIDDSPKHCLDCGSNGVAGVLFGNYAWNQVPKGEMPNYVQRVETWSEVEPLLLGLA
ncbi:unnamed protein product [Chrysoparadoxa australica]